jgi:hypothetical protein
VGERVSSSYQRYPAQRYLVLSLLNYTVFHYVFNCALKYLLQLKFSSVWSHNDLNVEIIQMTPRRKTGHHGWRPKDAVTFHHSSTEKVILCSSWKHGNGKKTFCVSLDWCQIIFQDFLWNGLENHSTNRANENQTDDFKITEEIATWRAVQLCRYSLD